MKFKLLCLMIISFGLLFYGCEGPEGPEGAQGPAGPAGPAGGIDPNEYANSEACMDCHEEIYTKFQDNGHGYKLNKVEGGVAPTYPFSSVPNPPAGYTWNDITYVIGGFGWKARFVDNDGYIITGPDVQYNLETQGWVAYHDGEAPGTKQYNCGACHTTGWDPDGQQDGLPGMAGSFTEPGVHCEACHGPGSIHVETGAPGDILRNSNSTMCGECHTRDSGNRIAASGGFIKHHEQYDEMRTGPHVVLECIECHDPHLGQQSAEYSRDAMLIQCQACHTDITTEAHPYSDCITCHMPEATKSAIADNIYNGDVMTHIFKLNTAAAGKDSLMFYDNGAFANGAVTLDYSCYQCHVDESGVGGTIMTASEKTLQELSDMATGIHGVMN